MFFESAKQKGLVNISLSLDCMTLWLIFWIFKRSYVRVGSVTVRLLPATSRRRRRRVPPQPGRENVLSPQLRPDGHALRHGGPAVGVHAAAARGGRCRRRVRPLLVHRETGPHGQRHSLAAATASHAAVHDAGPVRAPCRGGGQWWARSGPIASATALVTPCRRRHGHADGDGQCAQSIPSLSRHEPEYGVSRPESRHEPDRCVPLTRQIMF